MLGLGRGRKWGGGRVRLKESLHEYDCDFPAPRRIRNRQALEETLAHGHDIAKEMKRKTKNIIQMSNKKKRSEWKTGSKSVEET